MKDRHILIIIALLNSILFIGATQNVITRDANFPRGGDKLVKERVTMIVPGPAGENLIWDYSSVNILDGNHLVRYVALCDTSFSAIENRTRYDYQLRGDSLLWRGYENHLTKLGDSIPAIAMIYPFAYGMQARKCFYHKGNYTQTLSLDLAGESSIHADACGTLILPEGDTVCNVLRVHRQNSAYYRISKCDSLAPIDTLRDTLCRHIEDIYYWYASGYRYPLVETMCHTFFAGSRILSQSGTTYICPPCEQAFSNPDHENLSIRAKSPFQKPKRSSQEQADSRNTAPVISCNPNITQDGSTININYNVSCNSVIAMTLTDMQGRVFSVIPKHRASAGEYSESIDRCSLNPGEYLLYITIGGQIQVKKFALK